MDLSEFIDTYRDAIAQRVVESYPPRYRPSDCGKSLPHLLRTPMGAQADAIRAAALSLDAHRGTTVVGEMGTGKTFIAAAAAHMAGFRRVLVLCPPHLTRKWKREVEETVPEARAVIVASITDLERLRLSHGPGPLFAVMSRDDWRKRFDEGLPSASEAGLADGSLTLVSFDPYIYNRHQVATPKEGNLYPDDIERAVLALGSLRGQVFIQLSTYDVNDNNSQKDVIASLNSTLEPAAFNLCEVVRVDKRMMSLVYARDVSWSAELANLSDRFGSWSRP